MLFRNIFIVTKGTKVIFAITISVSILTVAFAYFYYKNLNDREDPRVIKAKEFLSSFEKESARINCLDAFPLLDSANKVFRSYPDYSSSFEIGLIHNNKCSALLMMALYDKSVSDKEKIVLLDLSMKYCDSSITIYRKWLSDWDTLSREAIAQRIRPFMNEDDPVFEGKNFKNIFAGRVKYIVSAQIETERRLSVSLCNKGTIYRHLLKPDSALSYYQNALSLWKENRTAKSNMSVLAGGDPVKPSLIEALFPPDRNKKQDRQ